MTRSLPARLALVALVIFPLLFANLAPAFACTPTPPGAPPPTTADKTLAAGAVLEGIVVSVTGDSFSQVAIVRVLQYLKSSGPPEVLVGGLGAPTLCRATVAVGDRLIFFTDNVFNVGDASDVAAPAPALIADIVLAAGQTPVAIQSATDIAATQAMAITLTLAPTPTPTPTVTCPVSSATYAQHTQAADIVLDGVVSATGSGESKTAVVEVVQYFKGDGPVRVQIAGFGSPSQCLTNVFVGQHWIFYANGAPALGLAALDTDEFNPVTRPAPLAYDEITAAAGQDPLFVQSLDSIQVMIALTATASPRVTLTEGAVLSFGLTLTAQPTRTPFPTPTLFVPPTPIPPTPLITAESLAMTGICSIITLVLGLAVGAAAGVTFKQRD